VDQTTHGWLIATLDGLRGPAFVLDGALAYVAFNAVHADVMRSLYGRAPRIGRPIAEFMTVELDRELALGNLRAALEGEAVVAQAPSGEGAAQRHFEVRHVPLRVEDAIAGVLVTADDVTERVRAESERAETRSLLEGLVARAPGMLFQARMRPGESPHFTFASPGVASVLGLSEDEVIGPAIDLLDRVHAEDRGRLLNAMARSTAQVSPLIEELRVLPEDGRQLWIHVSARPEREADGGLVWHGHAFDVTDRRLTEEQLRLATRVFNSTSQGIVVTDREGTIIQTNPAFEALTGYSAAEVVGLTPRVLKSGRHPPEFYAAMWATLLRDGEWEGEVWNRRKDGHVYPEALSISAVRGAAGEITHFVALFSDITERKAAAERIAYLAEHDALTGLPNRVLLADRAEVAILNARRDGKQIALLFVDLDRFKTVNDTLGHDAGDRLLSEVARRLRSTLRASDTVCRQGGDEFLVLMTGLADAEDAARVASKINAAIGKPMRIAGRELKTTASIGIAVFPTDGGDPRTLQRHADVAMYAAKSAGRNLYRFFTPEMNAHAVETLQLELDLRGAIERHGLRVEFQPQIRLGDGAVVGWEALARWTHPSLGPISPGRFIPIAEESGLIIELGAEILRAACQVRRRWLELGVTRGRVAVNVSTQQLRQSDFADRVRDTLAETGLAAELLELELTESALMSPGAPGFETLCALEEMGVLLAVDDFGTGYSSLSYLGRLPVRRLKIDRSFVSGIGVSSSAEEVVRAILALARALGLDTVAEGVETAAQAMWLVEHGCAEAQGYLFGRPGPVAEDGGPPPTSAEAARFSRRDPRARDESADRAER
jgi:diguanylate cyclase (GGDEF)-like protein/PAS domain S-box-containing protein